MNLIKFDLILKFWCIFSIMYLVALWVQCSMVLTYNTLNFLNKYFFILDTEKSTLLCVLIFGILETKRTDCQMDLSIYPVLF